MANGNIRGITVEFGGDTTKLGKALDTIFKDGKKVDSALKDVNKSLKFDPKNTELLSQKQALLAKKIDQTKKRLDVLKQAQATLDASGVDKSSDEYMKLRRQIMQAEGQLGAYETQLRRVESTQRSQQSAMEKLEGTISDQERELKALKDEYKNYVIEGKESSDAAKALKDKIKALSKELDDSKKSMSDAESAADKLDRSLKDTGDAAEKAGDGFTVMKGAVANLVSSGVESLIDKFKDLITSIASLPEETEEYRTAMSKLDAAFQASGRSSEDAKKTYKDLFGVLGDVDQATEASNLLANMSKNSGDLEKWTKILTGAYSKFGDSLPVEGLAEAAAETAKTGQVTGVFADALNWSSEAARMFARYMNKDVTTAEDAFNVALSECSDEQERQALITKTMTKLYGKAGDTYRKTNRDLIESRDATNELQEAQSNLAEKLVPVQTAWTNLKTKALDILTPAIEEFAEKALPAMQSAIEDIDVETLQKNVENIVESIQNAVTFIIDNKEIVIGAITGIAAAIAAMKIAGLVSSIAAIANPIGLIVTGIMAVIAILAACYAKFEWFRDGVNAVIDFIASIFEAIVPVIKAPIDFLIGIVTGWVEMIQSQFEFVASLPGRIEDGWSSLVDSFNGWVAEWKRLGSDIVAVASSIVSGVVGFFTSLREKVSGVFSSVKAAASNAWNNIKNSVLTHVKAIKDGVTNRFTALKDKVASIFNNVKTAITKPVEAAKDKISSIVEKIKGFFEKMKLSIPKINMPKFPEFRIVTKHFSKGPFNFNYPAGIDVKWHKDGGIFTSPTLLHGVGEAGAEAVLPLDMLWKKFDDMADSIVSGMATVMRSYSSGGNVGDIHLDVYLYPNGPKMGEQIVRAYDTYKPRLG